MSPTLNDVAPDVGLIVGNQQIFKAGRLVEFLPMWREITSDLNILQYVHGVKISFIEGIVPRQQPYLPSVFNGQQHEIVQNEIQSLLLKGVLRESHSETGEFVSTIFLRPKNDGSFRMILNLKQFNEWVEYHHFKMDTLDTVTRMMKPGCFMASVDLKDAYYTVPIHSDHQKYLKFMFNGTLYQYTCLPNGLSSAPRIFTKLLKPVYSTLHNKGHLSSGYIDDSYLQGDTVEECQQNITDTVRLFSRLGFHIHPTKSVFNPSHILTFLGFIVNSLEMTVSPTQEKIHKTTEACSALLNMVNPPIFEVAKVIGILVSNFPGVELGPLHYRALEHDKTSALAVNAGNYEASLQLSTTSVEELQWWVLHMPHAKRQISHGLPSVIIQSDASKKGWGAVFGGQGIGGRWTASEASRHINILELEAAFFALQSFGDKITGAHIQVHLDNTTAVAYINNMGGSKSLELNCLAIKIWDWSIQRDNWISAVHLAGKFNVRADAQSRNFSDKHEWTLNSSVFEDILNQYPELNIDLFATRLNHKLPTYCSWKPDPGCSYVDAFSINWGTYSFYAFPPFSLIPRCLQKISEDRAKGILVVPLWPTQSWFPIVLQLLYNQPWILSPDKQLLSHPTQGPHPLWQKLKLMVCPLSGTPSDNLMFLQRSQTSLWPHGDQVLKNNTRLTSKNGFCFVVKGKSITVHHRSVMH